MQAVYILTDWFLPAYKAGGPVQSLANMVSIEQSNISYRIVCSDKDLNGEVIPVRQNEWLSFNSSTEVFYSSKGWNTGVLKNHRGSLFINGIYSWQYNIKPILFSKASRKIVSARGMLHPGALSQKPLKKRLYLALWKFFGIHKRVEFHGSTEEEKSYIQAVFGKDVNVHVAANFPRIFQKQDVGNKASDSLSLVSIALLSPMKNILLILQALKHSTAKINYHIYGPVKDEKYWQQCEEVIGSLPSNVIVQYHGDVHPQKVEEALRTGHVFILPSKSENFGHAIFEALSAGKPVITSHTTPWNGLKEAKAGINVNPENGEELSNAILHFAKMEIEELEEWSAGANAYSEKRINIEEIKEQYRRMFGLQNQSQQSKVQHAQ